MRNRRLSYITSILLVFTIVILCFSCFAYIKYRNHEIKRQALANEISEYQRELSGLRFELENLESTNVAVEETRYLSIGFYIHEIEDIDKTEGLILLDLDANEELIAKAKETGRDIGYVYMPNVEIPDDAKILIVRDQYEGIGYFDIGPNTVMSHHIDNNYGYMYGDTVYMPYIYCKSDEYDITPRLSSFSKSMFVMIEVSSSRNYNLIKEVSGYEIVTIDEYKEAIINEYNTDGEVSGVNDKRIKEIKEEISRIEDIIDDLYNEWIKI